MPVRFLSDAQREQLSGFPAELEPESLDRFFTLSGPDLAEVRRRHGDENRLGWSGVGQPAARSSPSAASRPSRSTAAAIWCTRAGESPAAAASLRTETPSARAEASAQLRSRPACSRRHAARDTRSSTRRQAAIRSVIVTLTPCSPQGCSANWTLNGASWRRCYSAGGPRCWLAFPVLPHPHLDRGSP